MTEVGGYDTTLTSNFQMSEVGGYDTTLTSNFQMRLEVMTQH